MSNRNLPGLVGLALLMLAAPASARFNSPTLLFDTPTTDVLPAGSLAISADMTLPLTRSPANVDWVEADANIRFSPVKHLDFAVVAYTLKDYVLEAKYQLVGGEPERLGIAVGVCDVGINRYVSPLGHGLEDAWPDWRYNEDHSWYTRPYENFSAFAVASVPLLSFARLNVGLGRGRFVGYDGPNQYLTTDRVIFNREFHQWAVALFGGVEVYVTPNVALVAEANSRDMNSGIKADFGPISAALAWTKMEGLIFAEGDRFGRLELGATYKLGPWVRQPPPEAPTRPEELIPAPEQPPAPPIAEVLRLYPIWFMWDKWDITPVAAATLRRNAEVILSHPNIKMVTILGYASEEGTIEHNLPLSGRRANAALEYLKSLGVPSERMRARAMGESAGRPLPMHRSDYFELELEK